MARKARWAGTEPEPQAISVEALFLGDLIVVVGLRPRGVPDADHRGRDGQDTVIGGPGHDTLHGRLGQDACRGGTGNDTATTCETTFGMP